MVRGCQKKIIYLKNTDSRVFDEAYFIVKDNCPDDIRGECDMVEEANRILNECISYKIKGEKLGCLKRIIRTKSIPLLIGIISGILIGLLIK